MNEGEKLFAQKIKLGALIDISKVLGGIVLGAGAIAILAQIAGVNLSTLELLGLASMILHGIRLKSYFYNLFFTKRLLSQLGITIVTNESELKDALSRQEKEDD